MSAVLAEENAAQTIAARLREAREYLGLSQEFVARQMGLSRVSIVNIEGARQAVSAVAMGRYAWLYRRPIWWLYGEAEPAGEARTDPRDEQLLAAIGPVVSANDREQLRKFAEFLRYAGPAPNPGVLRTEEEDEC